MATYTIQKSWAYPPVRREGEDIAIQAVKHQKGHPELWGYIEDRDGRMDPCCTNAAWTAMMRLPDGDEKDSNGKQIEWLARPDILIQTFKGRKTIIHVISLCVLGVQVVESGPDSTIFLTEDDLGLRGLIMAGGVRMVAEEIIVDLKTSGLDSGEYKFTSDDPAWPWPILYPEKFTGLMLLGNILLKEDANPLTGLCRASDGAYRSLAKALAGNTSKAYKRIARDIVSLL